MPMFYIERICKKYIDLKPSEKVGYMRFTNIHACSAHLLPQMETGDRLLLRWYVKGEEKFKYLSKTK